jgi:hypothetical protein
MILHFNIFEIVLVSLVVLVRKNVAGIFSVGLELFLQFKPSPRIPQDFGVNHEPSL